MVAGDGGGAGGVCAAALRLFDFRDLFNREAAKSAKTDAKNNCGHG